MTRIPFLMLFGICSVCNGEFGFGPEVRIDSHYPEPVTGDVDVIRLPSGRFVVVWEGANYHYEDMKVICSYSDDFGSTWSDHIQVGDDDESVPQSARLACDSTGILYCVWEDWRALSHMLCASVVQLTEERHGYTQVSGYPMLVRLEWDLE